MNRLGNFYQWFWFHTEFWLTPVNRRPYTFIMRDWIYTHAPTFILLTSAWYVGLLLLTYLSPVSSLVLGCLSSLLLAHLVWGSKWIEKQQEYPEYLGDNNG